MIHYYTSHHPQAREFQEISEQLAIVQLLNENPEVFQAFYEHTDIQSAGRRPVNLKTKLNAQ